MHLSFAVLLCQVRVHREFDRCLRAGILRALRTCVHSPVSPRGNGAVVQVGNGSVIQILLERLHALSDRLLPDTPGSSGAQGSVPEEEQRAQGDLRDGGRKKKKASRAAPEGQAASSRSAVSVTICRLVHDMFAGPVCLASSSIRAAYIHLAAGETEELMRRLHHPPSAEGWRSGKKKKKGLTHPSRIWMSRSAGHCIGRLSLFTPLLLKLTWNQARELLPRR